VPGAQWDRATLEREFAKIRMTDKETYAGEEISGRYRMTTIWINRANEWRLLFEQEVPLTEEQ
jgi:hypothetical protein